MDPQLFGQLSRRSIITASAAGIALVAVGCSDSPTVDEDASSAPTPSNTTATASPSSTSSQTAAAGLVATSDVPVGGGVILSDHELVITQPSEGTFVGLSSICPHQQCPVGSVSNGVIVCPCHDSHFDLEGKVVQGPASSPLTARSISVAGGQISLA